MSPYQVIYTVSRESGVACENHNLFIASYSYSSKLMDSSTLMQFVFYLCIFEFPVTGNVCTCSTKSGYQSTAILGGPGGTQL